ncbi:uncharacterized protein LOC129278479 [Lytechinus pictus]|uniref:uncharacterized protein LOC129278479 n=1 Tax=Lytechinus pictus TaxID=7653 RepID=UPI0030B9D159
MADSAKTSAPGKSIAVEELLKRIFEQCQKHAQEGDKDSDDEISDDEESSESNDDDLVEIAYSAALGTIKPYDYEPLVPEAQAKADAEKRAKEEAAEAAMAYRLGNNDWCSCGGCQAMPTVKESVCCKEVEMIIRKMNAFEAEQYGLNCITEHPGFQPVCLNKYVLETALYQFLQEFKNAYIHNDTERYRNLAHRQLTRWCWHFLSRNLSKMVTIPSCALVKIHQAFP